VCGFVLYVVFTHMFEQGDFAAKATGVVAGLVVSLAVAWTAERLWETIDSGEFRLGGHTRRAFLAGLSLVVVFELSASAFEDFARELTGDFDGIKRIAAAVAGRDEGQAETPLSPDESRTLLAMLKEVALRLQALPSPGLEQTPGSRLLGLLTTRERLTIFYNEIRPTDEALAQVFFQSISPMLGVVSASSRLTDGCRERLRFISPPLSAGGIAIIPGSTAQDISACRAFLGSLNDRNRASRLAEAMQRVLARHDLFDAASFRQSIKGEPLGLERSVILTLEDQRRQCDAIRNSSPAASIRLCADAVRNGDARAGSGRLIDPGEMRALNRGLLAAAFPGAVQPLPVLWWDMALMLMMWCTSAMVVGGFLSQLTQAEETVTGVRGLGRRMFTAFCALWVAGLIAAAVLALVRLIPFLWQLMIDPERTAAHAAPGVFNFIPWAVNWLASGEDLAIAVPGWITVPVLFLSALVIWLRSEDEGLGPIAGFALLGIVLSAVAPVLDGLIGVVLLLVGAWFVPTFGIALLAPYLRPGRELPAWWGLVSLLGGLAVALWVAVILQDTDFTYRGIIAIAGLVAAATGTLILRRVPMNELWPLLAITIGLFILGLSAAFQQLTFAGALKQLHPVAYTQMPERIALKKNEDGDVIQYLTVLGPHSSDRPLPEAFRAGSDQDDVTVSLHLELALAGSIGFWLTLAMMVGWSLKQGPRKPLRREADGSAAQPAAQGAGA
jgi:hypothetical protein